MTKKELMAQLSGAQNIIEHQKQRIAGLHELLGELRQDVVRAKLGMPTIVDAREQLDLAARTRLGDPEAVRIADAAIDAEGEAALLKRAVRGNDGFEWPEKLAASLMTPLTGYDDVKARLLADVEFVTRLSREVRKTL